MGLLFSSLDNLRELVQTSYFCKGGKIAKFIEFATASASVKVSSNIAEPPPLLHYFLFPTQRLLVWHSVTNAMP